MTSTTLPEGSIFFGLNTKGIHNPPVRYETTHTSTIHPSTSTKNIFGGRRKWRVLCYVSLEVWFTMLLACKSDQQRRFHFLFLPWPLLKQGGLTKKKLKLVLLLPTVGTDCCFSFLPWPPRRTCTGNVSNEGFDLPIDVLDSGKEMQKIRIVKDPGAPIGS